MVEDSIAGTLDLAPVIQWLGLAEAYSHPDRGWTVRKYTRISGQDDGGAYDRANSFAQALAAAYWKHREVRVMALVRPQRLDDDLWRKINHVLRTGGPIKHWDMVRWIARLTHADQTIAEKAAVALYSEWARLAHIAEQENA